MSSPGFLFTVLAFLLVIGPLIFVHELGHYFAGRWFGVKAETFSIGFGREIFGWTDKRGTRWKVGWLPLGGYVRFKGDMNPASTPSDDWLALPPAEREESFQAKQLWQRFIIVAAGPLTNFLFAILVYIVLFASYGQPQTPPVVGALEPASAAVEAGIRPGDRIVSIDGAAVTTELCSATSHQHRWPFPLDHGGSCCQCASRRSVSSTARSQVVFFLARQGWLVCGGGKRADRSRRLVAAPGDGRRSDR